MPDNETLNTILNSYTISSVPAEGFNWGNLLVGLFFSIIGMYAFNHGRKERNYKPVVLGVALMGYPYFVNNTLYSIVIGVALTSAFLIWKD